MVYLKSNFIFEVCIVQCNVDICLVSFEPGTNSNKENPVRCNGYLNEEEVDPKYTADDHILAFQLLHCVFSSIGFILHHHSKVCCLMSLMITKAAIIWSELPWNSIQYINIENSYFWIV